MSDVFPDENVEEQLAEEAKQPEDAEPETLAEVIAQSESFVEVNDPAKAGTISITIRPGGGK